MGTDNNASNKELENCKNKVDSIGGALGTLLVIETIFCCYVLFCWVRNSRINLKRKETNLKDPGQDEYPMYTDADEVATQEQAQKRPKNGQRLGLLPQLGVALRPGHQPFSRKQPATEKIPDKKFIERPMVRRNSKPNRSTSKDLEMTALPSNEQAIEEDVGGFVYSQPYEDKVSAVSELMSRNPGSFCGKINKEQSPPEKQVTQPVYYHVLEENECDTNSPATPTKPLPSAQNEGAREDVYYYCDSNSPENKTANSQTTPSKPLPFAPTNPLEDDVYYSCVREASYNNPSHSENPKKALLPALPEIKSSPKATTSGLAAVQQKPNFHAQDNQSRNQKPEPANKKPLKPLNGNTMMKVQMIQEMKNRVANKKAVNY